MKVSTVATLDVCLYLWSSGGGGWEGLRLISPIMADTFQKYGMANRTPVTYAASPSVPPTTITDPKVVEKKDRSPLENASARSKPNRIVVLETVRSHLIRSGYTFRTISPWDGGDIVSNRLKIMRRNASPPSQNMAERMWAQARTAIRSWSTNDRRAQVEGVI